MRNSKLGVGLRVAAWLGVSVLLLGACSGGDGEGTGFCSTLEHRLRECELIGSGRFEACVNYGDKAEDCETRCLRDASCSTLGFYFCGSSGDNELFKCFRACSGNETFECGSGLELESYAVCDGLSDCPNGEDEENCVTFEPTFKCRNVDQSVSTTLCCDGKPDCDDGSDEPPDCAPAATCADGSPVSIWDYCDGQADCVDGADEPTGCVMSACPEL